MLNYEEIPDFLKKKEFPALNGFRALAIIAVIVSHFFMGRDNAFTELFSGYWGVQFFFVISGFLITTLLLRERSRNGSISFRKFYVRRALRIFPVAYLYIFTIFILSRLLGIEVGENSFITAALYIRNLPILNEIYEWYLGHYWSLSVEEQYYLYIPFALAVFSIRIFLFGVIGLVMLALGTIFLHYHVVPLDITVGFFSSLLGEQIAMLVGSACAVLVTYKKLTIPKFNSLVCFALILGSALIMSRTHFSSIPSLVKPLFAAIVLSVLLVAAIQHESGLLYAVLNNRLIVGIGLLSYSLYIWQQAFVFAPIFGFFGFGKNIGGLLNLPLLFLVAAASYYLYEKRFLKLKDRFK
jgi:peptidoglycan/LPS O-acetylase OafA/YrhL